MLKTNGMYKCLVFICPECRDAKTLQRDVVNSNRMTVMDETISSVKDDVQMIKDILLNGQKNPDIPVQNTYAQVVKSSDSVVVIKKGAEAEVVNRDIIKDASINSKVGISSTYNNNKGDTVLVCDSEQGKNRLVANLKEKIKNREIITPQPKRPTIRVTGLDLEPTPAEVLSSAKELNAEKGILIDEDNFKVIKIKPHFKNNKKFQVIVRVSNDIRAAIERADNFLFVCLNRCHVFDDLHVKRCNLCQGYNHYRDQCNKTVPVCGKCAESHETEQCTPEQAKCVNCTNNRFEETGHYTSDKNCRSYIAAQKKLEQSIGFYKQKNSTTNFR